MEDVRMYGNLKNIRYVFFDFDGTLADSTHILFKVYLSFLKKFGKNGKEEEFYGPLNGPTLQQLIAFLKRKYALPGNEKELLKEYENEVIKAYEERVKPSKSAESILSKLKKDRKIILVTSSKEKYITGLLEKLEWRKFFDIFIFGDNIKKAKPNPEIYLRALKRSGADPLKSVVIEDSYNGVIAAKKTGMRVIGISNNEDYRKKLRENGADPIVSNLSEILPILT